MRFSLPRPLHGWRRFLGEVGVIVIGVLIALGAQEAAESWNQHNDVAEARKALRAEIAIATADVRARIALSRCVNRRAADLEQWLEGYRKHDARSPIGTIGRPPSNPPISEAWETLKASPAAMHIPTQERLAYATLYARLQTIREIENAEREAWLELQDFQDAPDLDPTSAMKLRGLIYRVVQANDALHRYGRGALVAAAQMQVRPVTRPPAQASDLCRPLRLVRRTNARCGQSKGEASCS
jgi:hypothetical protein